jgi:trehalose/maltose transport system permease protein
MSTNSIMRQPLALRISSSAFLIFWCVVAAFPIFWIAVMSVKEPIDAFNSNPFNVIFGPETRANGEGLSILDIVFRIGVMFFAFKFATGWLVEKVKKFSPGGNIWAGWIVGAGAYVLVVLVVFFGILPVLLDGLNSITGPLGRDIIGFSTQHYSTVWFERGFLNNFQNSLLVTTGVVTVSLTFGTLAGYGLARSGSTIAFWILIIALIFRALPHSVLVAGYLPVFISSAEILQPFLGDAAPTLYGKPWATIAVLVSITAPLLFLILFFQRQIVSGLTAGAVKG